MTVAELNRDIKRLWNSIQKMKNGDDDKYFDYIANEAETEFYRLYRADTKAEDLNLKSLKIMHRLNQSHRFLAFHMFYINMEIN